VVNVANGADVDVRFCPFEFLLGHCSFNLLLWSGVNEIERRKLKTDPTTRSRAADRQDTHDVKRAAEGT
jgi:hypothetical protein